MEDQLIHGTSPIKILHQYFEEGRPFSATTLKTFEKCPRRFYYKTIGAPPEYHGSALVLGTHVHSAIEEKFTYDVPSFFCVKNFEENYMREVNEKRSGDYTGPPLKYTGSSPNKDLEAGAGMLEGFFNEYEALPVLGCETSLISNVPTPTAPAIIVVNIDLVIQGSKGIKVADVKSGKSAPNENYMKFDMQLNQYCYGLRHGKFVKLKDRATYSYEDIDPLFEDQGNIESKLIFNVRGFLNERFVSSQVEYESDEYEDDYFTKPFERDIKEMYEYEKSGFWPRRGVGSVHDSSCKFCEFRDRCFSDKG